MDLVSRESMNQTDSAEFFDSRNKRKDNNAASVKPEGGKKRERSTGKKIDLYVVVADDDVDDHKLIIKAVKDCGGNNLVTSVYNGLQLMNLLLRKGFYKVDSDRNPDIIILDLKMPVMDGYQALKEIKSHERLKEIPVFVLTDATSEDEAEKVTGLGADRFYSKPFSYEELKHLMDDICAEARRLVTARRVGSG